MPSRDHMLGFPQVLDFTDRALGIKKRGLSTRKKKQQKRHAIPNAESLDWQIYSHIGGWILRQQNGKVDCWDQETKDWKELENGARLLLIGYENGKVTEIDKLPNFVTK